jgi:hypothetical protein
METGISGASLYTSNLLEKVARYMATYHII